MAGVVAAVDGLFVQTIAPAPTESLNSTEYYSDQKKGYGFNVQAMATADYKFVSMTVKNPGATNDFAAFTRSQAWELTKKLPPGYFVVGDAAYPLCEQLLTPYPGRGLGKDYDVFNFYLSQQRIIVEQTFGILVQTWGILWRPLRVQFAGRSDLIAALFRLHNFLRDEGVGPVRPNEESPKARRARPVVDNDGRLPEKYVTHSAGIPRKAGETPRREAIRKAMAQLNLERPQHNVSRNSLLG